MGERFTRLEIEAQTSHECFQIVTVFLYHFHCSNLLCCCRHTISVRFFLLSCPQNKTLMWPWSTGRQCSSKLHMWKLMLQLHWSLHFFWRNEALLVWNVLSGNVEAEVQRQGVPGHSRMTGTEWSLGVLSNPSHTINLWIVFQPAPVCTPTRATIVEMLVFPSGHPSLDLVFPNLR